ncbi:MAG: hypothetical protein U5Q44_09990 [Dehalococcoidia bacterium]|nr:hypothetical protein [Dehalococcoidia bacterium]
MTAVTSDMVKELRDTTGAGVMECKRALEEAGGDFEKAQTVLKEKGLAAAAKRQERETYQGVVECRITGRSERWRPGGGQLRDGLRRKD